MWLHDGEFEGFGASLGRGDDYGASLANWYAIGWGVFHVNTSVPRPEDRPGVGAHALVRRHYQWASEQGGTVTRNAGRTVQVFVVHAKACSCSLAMSGRRQLIAVINNKSGERTPIGCTSPSHILTKSQTWEDRPHPFPLRDACPSNQRSRAIAPI